MLIALWAASCGPISRVPPAPPADQVAGPPGGGDLWTSDPTANEPIPAAQPRPIPESGSPSARPAGAAPSTEAQALLVVHNRLRAQHCAGPLTWSTKLAQVAQHWADSLRDEGCKFGHSGGTFGENLAAGTIGMMDPSAVVTMWYDELKGYSFKQPGFSMQTGHFTQVVWRGTTQVGCGRSQCKGMDIWVCEYDPPGNWEGQYREQVLPAGCR